MKKRLFIIIHILLILSSCARGSKPDNQIIDSLDLLSGCEVDIYGGNYGGAIVNVARVNMEMVEKIQFLLKNKKWSYLFTKSGNVPTLRGGSRELHFAVVGNVLEFVLDSEVNGKRKAKTSLSLNEINQLRFILWHDAPPLK
ncbi:MAG: hypothetical protein ACOYOF_13045 [Verrucomicrobiaceae bacterium]